MYTGYAGCAITAGIPVKFGTAHGIISRPEVGSSKCIDVYGRKGVAPFSRIFGTIDQKIIPPTIFLRSVQNFYSLTLCNLDKYLQKGSKKSGFLSYTNFRSP